MKKDSTSTTAIVNGKHVHLFVRDFLPCYLVSYLKRYELYLASADEIIRSFLGKYTDYNQTNLDNTLKTVVDSPTKILNLK